MTIDRMKSKVCIVTGSSSGLGRAIAINFAQEGAKLIICGDTRRFPRGCDPKEINGHSRTAPDATRQSTDDIICHIHGEMKALFVPVDVTNCDQVQNLIAKALEVGGRLDVIVNNAGFGPSPMSLHDTPNNMWDLTMNVNIRGSFLCSKYAIKAFMDQSSGEDQHRGRIINIASAAGLKETRLSAAYCCSKAAIISLTKTTALDYATSGIICNAICPGFINTAMTKDLFEVPEFEAMFNQMTPLGLPETAQQDVARAAVFLASEDSTWMTGVILPVDGGYSIGS